MAWSSFQNYLLKKIGIQTNLHRVRQLMNSNSSTSSLVVLNLYILGICLDSYKCKLKPLLTELSTVSEALSSTKYIPHLPAEKNWYEFKNVYALLPYMVKGMPLESVGLNLNPRTQNEFLILNKYF